jgi:PAS domain S-box-containing protein
MAETSVARPDLLLVLERITDGFFALDSQWRITYMNGEARKLLDAQGDFIGRFWLDAFPRARGRLFEREYARAMKEQQTVQFVEFSDTSKRWLEVKAYPSPDGLSVYFRDVSARVEAQHEVERNARRQQALIAFGREALGGLTYEQLLSDAVDLLVETLEVGVIDVFDYDRDEERFSTRRSIGWKAGTAFDPQTPLLAHVQHAVRTGESYVCYDLTSDPRARRLSAMSQFGVQSCIAVPIGTPHRPIGALAVFYADVRTFPVGDVRFVEAIGQTVAEAAAALESNRRMAQVLESIRDAFVAVDRQLTISYVNERMARFWDSAPAEMIGVPLERFVHDFGNGDVTLENFALALREERSLTFEVQFKDRWFETRLYPFASGVAAYVRDVTTRKTEQQRVLDLNAELERRVAQRTAQLELANKELESFSYSVSHDLRAPLRAIDGFSLALVEDYAERLDERANGYITRVRKAAQRMADLIDALLRLAKVARAPMTMVPVDLSALAVRIASELHESDPQRHVEIEVAPGLRALGEPNLLLAVLQNLMGNAWKFTRARADARIEVGQADDGEFFVRDNGAGFDMAYVSKLFGAFQRLHSADDYEGTGIGLATVARIVHRHGGEIRAEGAVGAGARFGFTLPQREDATA